MLHEWLDPNNLWLTGPVWLVIIWLVLGVIGGTLLWWKKGEK